MIRKTLSVLIAGLMVVGFSAAQAQDKTRAEVKAETRAAGETGSKSAETPTPGGKVVGGQTRAEVKASRPKTDSGAQSADTPTPGGKIVGGKSRAEVKSSRPKTDSGAMTADSPTPGVQKPGLIHRKKKAAE